MQGETAVLKKVCNVLEAKQHTDRKVDELKRTKKMKEETDVETKMYTLIQVKAVSQ